MKFSAATLPLIALVAQQASALALPFNLFSDSIEVRDAHHHHQGFGFNRGGGRFGNGQGGKGQAQNQNQGGNNNQNNNNNKGKAAAGAAGGAAAGGAAAAAAAAVNKGGSASSSTSAAAAASSSAAAASVNAGNSTAANSANAQSSLNLDASQVQPGLAQNGQETPEAGQIASATSVNNFINFCATQQTTLTNGLQTKAGSCNPTIMGRVVASANLPSAKFQSPTNGQVIKANTDFNIELNVAHMQTGNFVNPDTNFFAAPCQVNAAGDVIGHNHVVVEALSSLTSTTVTDPTTFAFFKGLNDAAVNGVLSTTVTGGLKAGAYRVSTISTCANHQPVLGSIAQHATYEDAAYFTVQ